MRVRREDFAEMTEDRPGRTLPGLRAMVEKVRGKDRDEARPHDWRVGCAGVTSLGWCRKDAVYYVEHDDDLGLLAYRACPDHLEDVVRLTSEGCAMVTVGLIHHPGLLPGVTYRLAGTREGQHHSCRTGWWPNERTTP